jgi:hypothetical protein
MFTLPIRLFTEFSRFKKGETRCLVSCAFLAVEQITEIESRLHGAAWTDALIFLDRFLALSARAEKSAGQPVAIVGRTPLIAYALVVVCGCIRDFHAYITALCVYDTRLYVILALLTAF